MRPKLTRNVVTCAIVGLATGIAVLPTSADPAKPAYRWDKPIRWEESDGPEAREHGAVILDENRDRVLVIGGSGYKPQFSPLDDAWQFWLKTDTWTRLKPTTPVPSGGSRRVAQMPGRGVAYLFGGYGAQEVTHNELVRVEFTEEQPSFVTVPQDDPPQSRCLHAFVYDPKLDLFILFGGMTTGRGWPEIHNDVWTMKLVGGRAKWTQLAVKQPPTPRYGFFYGYDPDGGRLIVFSGAQGVLWVNPAHDTWLLSTREQPPAWKKWEKDSPPGRRNGCFVYDPAEQCLFIFGGTPDKRNSEPNLSVFDARADGKGWSVLRLADGPAPRSSGFGFLDRSRKRILMGFGNDTRPYRDLFPLRY
jgi:hypothetical protein